MNSSDTRRKTSALWLFKLSVVALVTWGIIQSFSEARDELAVLSFSVAQLRWPWVAISAGCYALGLMPMGCYWYWLLRRLGQAPGGYETIRAYFIGHLGKYVPGKVMVLLLRVSLIRSQRVDAVVATASVFVETLTMMASGAFLAAACLAFWFRDQRALQVLAACLMLATVVATLPPVLRRILGRLKKSENAAEVHRVVEHVNWITVAAGWIACSAGWCLLALSLWATVQAMPTVPEPMRSLTAESFARVLASVALAIVAGFLSLLPGGLGVREWVLDRLMVPVLGVATSIIVAILLRVVWLVTELALSIILYVFPPRVSSSDS